MISPFRILTTFCSLLLVAESWGQAGAKDDQTRALVSTESILQLFTKPDADLRAIGVFEAPSISTQILFKTDSLELADDFSERQLEQVGKALQDGRLANYFFSVEGHTDARGAQEYNMNLSQRRSEEIVRRLAEEYGIVRNRLVANGRGEFELLVDGETEEDHQQNRRVVFVRG